MKTQLKIYNSLSRDKEVFEPLVEGRVGMYVCGPTVYSDVHLGNCRTFVSFDVIFRYLQYLGYKVRYVRNITDVGHLEGDVDIDAEDKIAKKARLEEVEPMEIAQRYANGFHDMMHTFNILPPSIEPRATGHILEQIEMVQDILNNGYAYEANGSVYFDTLKFATENSVYGKLSGRVLEDLVAESRDNLKNQDEKRHPSDFAIWIKAHPGHIMRWNSPWSVGFPGWHLECSAMSTKYLGKQFDIHGGGADLKFPHHENEIAQNYGACHCAPAKYWLHGNMLLLNGKKMSKSDGNSITPQQLFSGDSPHVTKGYSAMVVRFFMLQAHYRSTLDLTDDALQAAEKAYHKLLETNVQLQALQHPGGEAQQADTDKTIQDLLDNMLEGMNDDFNTAKVIARMMELSSFVNKFANKQLPLTAVSAATVKRMQQLFNDFIYTIFGLKNEQEVAASNGHNILDGLMQLVIEMRQDARARKDWGSADKIRDTLTALKIQLKDSKEGTSWTVE